jgi:MFS family permease
MPYFMVYIQKVLKYDLVVCAGSILGSACVITVLIGFYMDKIGKHKVIIGALLLTILGAMLMFFFQDLVGVIIGGIILMSGFLICTAVFGAKIRDYTPEKEVGLFQGVRMIFAVLVPMVTGPFIGEGASYINGIMMVDDYGRESIQPNQYVFLFTAIVMLFVFIPLVILIRRERKDGEKTA